jgi:hypothetical protein
VSRTRPRSLPDCIDERHRYDEIRSLYVDQLASVWMEDSTTETTRASVDKKIDSFVEGDLEHATEMLSALWGIINGDGDIKPPTDISSAVSPVWFCLLPCVIREYSLHIIRRCRSRAPPIGPL